MLKQLLWLIIWGVVFGYMEAAVVVYLREIYYPEGFAFPLVIIEDRILLTELLREAATLLLIWTTVSLAYKRVQSRFAAFFVLFGFWDIFYYISLKLLLAWPENLNTWDILFLIPAPWVGPVWAPVLVSLGFIYAGTTVLFHNHQNSFLTFDRGFIMMEIFSALLIIVSFMIPGSSVLDQNTPTDFPWILFLAGFLIGIGIFLYTVYRHGHTDRQW
ncbi:hypothetical protein [Sulfurovum sp. TSL1]|uniref:hypothetical protein n=1 Tax=Sulfurovum sp. TSL1 TaxID=2826994 RepID=UPI001CC7B194|nr:hypothetical protein [Sulfurovum sp. TSL1]GIT97842.1 hypothetical protein TSL1_06630 [Sulfurovum sp. TSL1]